jgi:hypothetical protein
VLGENSKLCLIEWEMFEDYSRMCRQIILAPFFTWNALGVNVYKTFKCDKNYVPYHNVQGSKKWNWGPLIKHDSHLIIFIILTFVSEKNKYSRYLYKIWNFFFNLTWKKREESMTSFKFREEKGSLGILRVFPCVSNRVAQSCLNPSSFHGSKRLCLCICDCDGNEYLCTSLKNLGRQ